MSLRRTPLRALLLTLTLALAGGVEPSQAAGSPLVVYTARKYQLVDTLFAEYGKLRGIDVTFVTDDGAPLIQRLKAEGKNTPADLLVTVDAGDLWRATEAGLLAPLHSRTLEDAIPANLRDPKRYWFGLAVRARTIAYSTERVKPADLATSSLLVLRSGKKKYALLRFKA